MTISEDEERAFDGGAQPVKEQPPEVPTAGWTVGQTVVVVASVIVLLAAVLYVVARISGG
ncbi:MAG: hypothetical protein KY464_09030 [Gemmatimonadetes bacterium]|nr:hypothetical protein [Gemmatimonadota bacterium]